MNAAIEKIKSTQELREGIQNVNLLGFLQLLEAHKDVIVKLAQKDARFRQVLKMKLEVLKQHSRIDIMYFEMVA